MNSEPNNVDSSNVKIEIIPQTINEMVDREMAGESDDVRKETKALIDAIKMRAQAEAQSAGTLTRETYLNAVRRVRESVEGNHLIERDRIEQSFEMIQREADKNWQSIVKEASELGDRLADAAKAAWDTLTAPRH